jgi:hypothetical protein
MIDNSKLTRPRWNSYLTSLKEMWTAHELTVLVELIKKD